MILLLETHGLNLHRDLISGAGMQNTSQPRPNALPDAVGAARTDFSDVRIFDFDYRIYGFRKI